MRARRDRGEGPNNQHDGMRNEQCERVGAGEEKGGYDEERWQVRPCRQSVIDMSNIEGARRLREERKGKDGRLDSLMATNIRRSQQSTKDDGCPAATITGGEVTVVNCWLLSPSNHIGDCVGERGGARGSKYDCRQAGRIVACGGEG